MSDVFVFYCQCHQHLLYSSYFDLESDGNVNILVKSTVDYPSVTFAVRSECSCTDMSILLSLKGTPKGAEHPLFTHWTLMGVRVGLWDSSESAVGVECRPLFPATAAPPILKIYTFYSISLFILVLINVYTRIMSTNLPPRAHLAPYIPNYVPNYIRLALVNFQSIRTLIGALQIAAVAVLRPLLISRRQQI